MSAGISVLACALWLGGAVAAQSSFVLDVRKDAVGSNPGFVTPFYGYTLFWADDGEHGVELWRTDGTPAGTKLVRDIYTGSTHFGYHRITVAGRYAYFVKFGASNVTLWRTDATEAGTQLIESFPLGSAVRDLTPFRGRLFFRVGTQLWRSDGTGDGTEQVTYGVHARPVPFCNMLYLACSRPGTGEELYRTNGEGAPTTVELVANLTGSPASSYPRRMVASDDFLWVTPGLSNPKALWRTSGSSSPGATEMVRDFAADGATGEIRLLGTVRSRVYFSVAMPDTGREMWRCDGPKATVDIVADIAKDEASSDPGPITLLGPRIVFAATRPDVGREPFYSDGGDTTKLLANLAPGTASSNPRRFLRTGTYGAYFQADVAPGDRRIVKTNAHPANTYSYFGVGTPSDHVLNHGRLLLVAQDPNLGRELWSVRLRGSYRRVGHAYSGRVCAPTIDATTPEIGHTMRFRGRRLPPQLQQVWLLFGAKATSPVPVLGPQGLLYLEYTGTRLAVSVVKDAWSLDLPVPPLPALIGRTYVAQLAALAAQFTVELSAGIELTIGG